MHVETDGRKMKTHNTLFVFPFYFITQDASFAISFQTTRKIGVGREGKSEDFFDGRWKYIVLRFDLDCDDMISFNFPFCGKRKREKRGFVEHVKPYVRR